MQNNNLSREFYGHPVLKFEIISLLFKRMCAFVCVCVCVCVCSLRL